MKLAHALIFGGALLMLVAWFPLGYSAFLSRDAQWLAGAFAFIVGLSLLEVRSWLGRDTRERTER